MDGNLFIVKPIVFDLVFFLLQFNKIRAACAACC